MLTISEQLNRGTNYDTCRYQPVKFSVSFTDTKLLFFFACKTLQFPILVFYVCEAIKTTTSRLVRVLKGDGDVLCMTQVVNELFQM